MAEGTDIATALQNWRTRHNLTQQQTAPYFGVSPRTIQAWETGRGCTMAVLLLRLLQHTPAELARFLGL